VEFWYNTSFHSALGRSNTSFHSALDRSPFEALYGRQPRLLGVCVQPAASGQLEEWLIERANMDDLIKQHLARARCHMKNIADKKRSERQFTVGDMIYMKLQPYIQTSVATRANHKLSFRYLDPFPVVARIGAVA
jgi:hypothetical protein